MPGDIPLQANDEWDAGHIGCGELLVKLHLRMRALQPGRLFRLVSLDPAAPEELPVWWRLTSHKLISARHPEYWIQRKGELASAQIAEANLANIARVADRLRARR